MVFLFTFYRNETEIIDSLNKVLLCIAFMDFGLQQSAIMKYLSSKKYLIIETVLASLLLFIIFLTGLFKLLTFKLVLLAYLINVIQAILYRNEFLLCLFVIVFIRILFLILSIEFDTLLFFVEVSVLTVALFLLGIKGSSIKKKNSYRRKRFELGIIAMTAVLNEQLVRMSDDLDYKLSILLLVVGYIVSFVSILQQTIIQYIFTNAREDKVTFWLTEKNLIILTLFSITIVLSASTLLSVHSLEINILLSLMITSNIFLRFCLLRDNVSERTLIPYVLLNFFILVSCSILVTIDIDIFRIQMFVSILIIIFTMVKVLWNTPKLDVRYF